MKKDNDKYINPETNPSIATDDDSKEDPEDLGGLENGLPFQMREKIDSKDLAKRIKITFPEQSEIFIDDGISLGVQTGGDVEIIKLKKEKKGWNRTLLEKGSSADLATVKRFIDGKEK